MKKSRFYSYNVVVWLLYYVLIYCYTSVNLFLICNILRNLWVFSLKWSKAYLERKIPTVIHFAILCLCFGNLTVFKGIVLSRVSSTQFFLIPCSSPDSSNAINPLRREAIRSAIRSANNLLKPDRTATYCMELQRMGFIRIGGTDVLNSLKHLYRHGKPLRTVRIFGRIDTL